MVKAAYFGTDVPGSELLVQPAQAQQQPTAPPPFPPPEGFPPPSTLPGRMPGREPRRPRGDFDDGITMEQAYTDMMRSRGFPDFTIPNPATATPEQLISIMDQLAGVAATDSEVEGLEVLAEQWGIPSPYERPPEPDGTPRPQADPKFIPGK